MSHTEGRYAQDLPNTDMEIFIDPYHFFTSAGSAPMARDGAGLFNLAIPASQTVLTSGLFTPKLRTGMLADVYSQEQFGTATNVPGPSAVAGTSDPLNLVQGMPPLTAAQMATLGHMLNGPMPKGIQINSIDVIYSVGTLALTSMTVGVNKTVFANGIAPAVTALLATANNGLPLTVTTQPNVKNIALPNPAFITDKDTLISVELNVVTPATSTCKIYGVVAKCSFNFN